MFFVFLLQQSTAGAVGAEEVKPNKVSLKE